jgi:RNA polymerase sigma-70 factor, ECF subfamily
MLRERPGGEETAATEDISRRGPPRAEASQAEDVSLIARVAAGDRIAFEALYRIYFPRLTRFLERVLRRPHLVEEALNDTMLVVWHKAATYNGTSKVSTWIFGIGYRKALKAVRRIDDPVESDDDEESEREVGLGPPTPEDQLIRRELAAALGAALARMSPEQRAVVELTYYHGCAYREIAEIMSCPIDTVKTRMFHARRRLRVLLAGRRQEL